MTAPTDDDDLDALTPSAERLVADAVALAGEDRSTAALVERFWRFAPDEELIGVTPQELLDAAISHRELAAVRLPGEVKLVTTPPTGSRAHTVLQIIVDDMPFIVDSVIALLTAHQLQVHLLIHPPIVVRREPLGALSEAAADVDPDDAIDGDLVENWTLIEIDPIRSAEVRDQLDREVRRVLTDVRDAVEDWPRMRQRALVIADELAAARGSERMLPVPDKDVTDAIELLKWLAHDHFTFLGYREYRLDGDVLKGVPGTGLGILRGDSLPRKLSSMTDEAFQRALEKRLLTITKANSRATVHRSAYLDYISTKVFDDHGDVVGEKRFLGLFSSAAYRTSIHQLPVVKRKVAEVLDRSGLSPRGHSGKDLLQILETYPRDELFQIKTDDLYETVTGVLRMAGRRQLRLFLRRDGYGRFISCLIYMPRDRFTTGNRLRMQEVLLRELNGVGVDYTTRVTERMLARVHFIVRTDPAEPPGEIDANALAEMLADATRMWDDDFALVLERKLGEEPARDLFTRYATAYPESYKDSHTPYEGLKDLAKLELLEEGGQLEMHLYRKPRPGPGPDGTIESDDHDVRFKVYRYGEPMLLSAVLPVLHSLGVQVKDERPYEIRRNDGTIYLYDFWLTPPESHRELAEVRPQVENVFAAAWRGETEVDGFNELVLRAGLTWRQVVVLRAYAKYQRQTGSVFSQRYIEATLIAYPEIARLLVRLFETRFSPRLEAGEAERGRMTGELVEHITSELDEVTSLDQDRILRSYLRLIEATLRTSFFQRGPDGRPKSYIAFKLDPQAIADLPRPRPKFEIFVYSPRFEGVHLRFGAVARGGLRWSDRREDYRTEILGLLRAQVVNNAVVVPTGAKGGFVLKQRPGDRDEAVECYKRFVVALLDVTDNIAGGKIVPPRDVVIHDGDDPYLVVEADRGTTTFSDIANEISVSKGFWLGDAFASGGSAGYDHKKMGITARGAWQSVDHHLGGRSPVVAGIGDMSGEMASEVFGTGMLVSDQLRLVAAFDHRHIFVDPNPDPAVSFAERRRLFGLARSSWADYDPALISAGGGVHPRTAKSIEITPQVRQALDLPLEVTMLAPAELIRAILAAPVDLLWNGGVGTYVKASLETQAEVQDRANDSVRINARELRAACVVEGGNLGLTQAARVEYARAGGRVFTDFIDNCAGVACSDREVNIKILLDGAKAEGELTVPERDSLLAAMTDEVAARVLRDSHDQTTALSIALADSRRHGAVHDRMLTLMEKRGELDRSLEGLPGSAELTAPELAVLLAHAKISTKRELLADEICDEEWTGALLAGYFPAPLRQRFAGRMRGHRLRREIVATELVNEVVNRGGTSFVFRAQEETGGTVADIVRAFVVVSQAFGVAQLWEEIDGRQPGYRELRSFLDLTVRRLVSTRRSPLDVAREIASLQPHVAPLLTALPDHLRGTERAAFDEHLNRLSDAGLPARLARLDHGVAVLDVLEIAPMMNRPADEVAAVYFALSERVGAQDLLAKVAALRHKDRQQAVVRALLRANIGAAISALTAEVLASHDHVDQWAEAAALLLRRLAINRAEFDESAGDLPALYVYLSDLRTLVVAAAV